MPAAQGMAAVRPLPAPWQSIFRVLEQWPSIQKSWALRGGMSVASAREAQSLVVNGTRIDSTKRVLARRCYTFTPRTASSRRPRPSTNSPRARASSRRPIPGYGRSELPKGMRTVDDLSYFYLDLLDQLNLKDLAVVGTCFGAWIAAEIAVKTTARMARLVMANAVGVKVGDRETRDIADIFASPSRNISPSLIATRKSASATTRRCPIPRCSPRRGRARPRRALPGTRTFTIHGSKAGCTASASRRCCPWGSHDRMLSEAYGRAYCAMIAGARFELIDRAGHFPDHEQPKIFAEKVLAFAKAK